jgi:excisionase family DNA binding protein
MSARKNPQSTTQQTIAPRLLNVERASEYLGTTTWAVRKLAWAKTVPHIRLGSKILFDIADLDRFIERAKLGGKFGTACNAMGVAR